MWRPAHGATSRPGPSRPTSGYGRALGRPGPCIDAAPDEPPAGGCTLSRFDELVRELVRAVRAADGETAETAQTAETTETTEATETTEVTVTA